MQKGLIATEQRQGGFLGLPSCSKVYFAESLDMGFFGKPAGEDVTVKRIESRYLAIPAARCQGCRVILFAY